MLRTALVISATTLAAALAAPCASFAQDRAAKMEAAFKKADKDNDGTLDKEEAKAMPHVAKNFDAIDADKDGTVSLEEIQNFMKAHHQGSTQKQ